METSLNYQNKKNNHFDNRFILKLFGERNHDYINIESDTSISINKGQIDKYENKGQVSQWKFQMDQIYNEEITIDQLYENEIECNDFLNGFQLSTYRNIIFIGDKSDSLNQMPLSIFMKKILVDCYDSLSNFNKENYFTTISYIEATSTNKIIDYFQQPNKNNLINNPKINYYDDDITIEQASQVSIDSAEKFESLLNYSLTISNSNLFINVPSFELISFRLLDHSKNDECLSKINFILYKAYALDKINCGEYKLFTKENYNFFHSAHNEINLRLSYVMKYIKDIFYQGKSLFIFIIPSEKEYIVLLHDLLNYVKMRKLILHNFTIEDKNDVEEIIKNFGNIHLFENISTNNSNKNNNNNKNCCENKNSIEHCENMSNKENESFCSNNLIFDNNSFTVFRDSFAASTNSLNISNSNNNINNNNTNYQKKERTKLNRDRLMKIQNKSQVKKLFDCFDENQ